MLSKEGEALLAEVNRLLEASEHGTDVYTCLEDWRYSDEVLLVARHELMKWDREDGRG